jgi:hypothetical protein
MQVPHVRGVQKEKKKKGYTCFDSGAAKRICTVNSETLCTLQSYQIQSAETNTTYNLRP